MTKHHRDYFNRLASTWKVESADDEILFSYLASFDVKQDDHVLDIGCGTGRLTQLLRRMIGNDGRLVEADFAQDMLCAAKMAHPEAKYVCTDACSMAFVPATFDKIVCFATFPHIREPMMALQEMHRILKPSGRLLILHTCCSRRLNALHSKFDNIIAGDFLPRARELKLSLQRVNFENINIIENPQLYWVDARKA